MTYPPQYPGAPAYTGPGAPPPLAEGIQLSHHVGDLVWIKVHEYVPAYEFPFGIKPAVRVDLEFLTGRADVGERQLSSHLSNIMLVKQLAGSIGHEHFGRIAEYPGKNANAAIYLDPPWPGDEAAVNAFQARNAGGNGATAPQHGPQQPQGAPNGSAAPQGYQGGYGQPPAQPQPQQAYPPQGPPPSYPAPSYPAPPPSYPAPSYPAPPPSYPAPSYPAPSYPAPAQNYPPQSSQGYPPSTMPPPMPQAPAPANDPAPF